MRFTATSLFYVAAQLALVNGLAVPIARDEQAAAQQMQARAEGGAAGAAAGGIATILKDHVKFMTAPATAEEEIPKEENNAMREGHRQVHKSLYEMMTGGKKAGDAADKAGDAADKAGDAADKAGEGKDKGKEKGAEDEEEDA
ncbi:hypothetical protein ISF_06017 [Cordyceps fumosorosea ARSEF 2679]|uniref:Uncharacterized protein n=1 Tax=Cordyceps fumosorosea (strain ARSEF 2679) TaxID=1081104 RepID=A0A167SWQ8_CORFA|nr:hypothetical protein ISF_06017 [Cordyceps fumosorosea ARSEF 2679]OAA60006.1 hypothetical protein ISF_06017 [Cordyceps fumosorosea ARSEF 2679]